MSISHEITRSVADDGRLAGYDTSGFYDEMFEADGKPRARGELLAARLQSLSQGELQRRQKAAVPATRAVEIRRRSRGGLQSQVRPERPAAH